MTNKKQQYETAIKKTLLYSSIFKYPLTYYQILNYLIIDQIKDVNIKSFEYELAKLIKKQYILVKDEKCFLPGIKYANWNKRRKKSKRLYKKNKYVFNILKKIPWIKFIGATGSYAAKNSDDNSDLDIFIITQKNRVWITRLFVTIILKFIFKNYVKKGVDPNIYIDETNLNWPKDRQNLYVANEIIRMEPIFEKDELYFRFLNQNKWIFKYLGNFKTCNIKNNYLIKKYPTEFIINFIDTLLMKMQINYMKKRITTELVKKNFIHFNKNDSTHPVLSRYNEKIKNI